ncbi:MAG: hypothetical protein ABSF21_00075 [Dehalococcoidia bacterium]|jgi:hypothetical protein
MLRKVLLILTIMVILVVSIALMFTGPPGFAMLPPVLTAGAIPLVASLKRRVTPVPKMLCVVRESIQAFDSFYITKVLRLGRSAFQQVSFTTLSYRLNSFRYAFSTGARFLTVRLNV